MAGPSARRGAAGRPAIQARGRARPAPEGIHQAARNSFHFSV